MAFKTKAEKAFDEKLSAAIDAHDWDEVERLFNKLASVYELIHGEGEAGYCVVINLKLDRVLNYDEEDDEPEEEASLLPIFDMLSGKPFVLDEVDRKCGICGKNPAEGLASIEEGGVETYYCHGDEQDDLTCYQIVQLGSTSTTDQIPF